jgi:hypothetical protein
MSSNGVEDNRQYINSIIVGNFQRNHIFTIKLNDYTILRI